MTKLELDNLLENGVIEPHKVTELFYNGESIWKGLSEDVKDFADCFKFVKFNHDISEGFNKPYYSIEVDLNEDVLDESGRIRKGVKYNNIITSADASEKEKRNAEIKASTLNTGNNAGRLLSQGIKEKDIAKIRSAKLMIKHAKDIKNEKVKQEPTLNILNQNTDPQYAKKLDQEDKQYANVNSSYNYDNERSVNGLTKNYLKEEPTESLNVEGSVKSQVLNNLRLDVQGEYDAIMGYDKRADFAEENGYKDIAELLRSIRDEEKVHLGELNAALKKYDETFAKSTEDGDKEAEDHLEK